MILLYKDMGLEITIPENYEESKLCQTDHKWCTYDEQTYNRHTKLNKEILIRFIYRDGYIMSLGVNKNDLSVGQWVDNNEQNDIHTFYPLNLMDENIFNYKKMLNVSMRKKDKNLKNMAMRIRNLSENIKNIILLNL